MIKAILIASHYKSYHGLSREQAVKDYMYEKTIPDLVQCYWETSTSGPAQLLDLTYAHVITGRNIF